MGGSTLLLLLESTAGPASAGGSAPSLSVAAPPGSATGSASASGTSPGLVVAAPSGSATGGSGSIAGNAGGAAPRLFVVAPGGSASGGTSSIVTVTVTGLAPGVTGYYASGNTSLAYRAYGMAGGPYTAWLTEVPGSPGTYTFDASVFPAGGEDDYDICLASGSSPAVGDLTIAPAGAVNVGAGGDNGGGGGGGTVTPPVQAWISLELFLLLQYRPTALPPDLPAAIQQAFASRSANDWVAGGITYGQALAGTEAPYVAFHDAAGDPRFYTGPDYDWPTRFQFDAFGRDGNEAWRVADAIVATFNTRTGVLRFAGGYAPYASPKSRMLDPAEYPDDLGNRLRRVMVDVLFTAFRTASA